jgi:hypothetical protein
MCRHTRCVVVDMIWYEPDRIAEIVLKCVVHGAASAFVQRLLRFHNLDKIILRQ